MVTTDGRLKVLDFGLAKVMEDARLVADAGMPTAASTGEGRIVDTVSYMSPEQAEGIRGPMCSRSGRACGRRVADTVPANAIWTPDSRAFLYYPGRAGVGNVFRQPLPGGPPTPLTQFASEQIFAYALSPDQKQLAVVRGCVSSDVVLVSTQERQQNP